MRLFGLCVLVVMLTACSSGGSDRMLYHTLGNAGDVGSVNPKVSTRIKSVGVGPVKLASILDRKEVVVRLSDNTAKVSVWHEWGGELEQEFIAALAQQLQQRLPNTRVQRVPWEITQTPQYQVELIIDQFDGAPEKTANMRGQWQLQEAKSGKILSSHSIRLSQPVSGKAVKDIVQSQVQLMRQLSRQIVEVLAKQ